MPSLERVHRSLDPLDKKLVEFGAPLTLSMEERGEVMPGLSEALTAFGGHELCKCHDLIYVIQESYPGPRTPDLLPLLRESHQELTTLIIDRSKSLAKFDTAEE